MQAIYDPEVARKGVEEVWAKLNELATEVAARANADDLKDDEFEALAARYNDFPISFQINWSLTKHTPEEAQKIADAMRADLQAAGGRIGSNRAFSRLFNAE